MLLTTAGVPEQLGGRDQPGGGQGRAPGVAVRVVHPPPHGLAVELRHRVPEDQLPPPAPPAGLLLSCSSFVLHTGGGTAKAPFILSLVSFCFYIRSWNYVGCQVV